MKKKYSWKIAGAALLGVAVLTGGTVLGVQQYAKFAGDKAGAVSTGNKFVVNNTYSAKQLAAKQEKHEITIHYKWSGSQPHLYYKVEKTKEESTYPGVPMKDEGNGWFTYTVSNAEEANLIMSVPEKDYQTSDFSRDEGEYWYDDETGWYVSAPDSYEAPATTEEVVSQKQQMTEEETEEISMDEKNLAEESSVTLHFPGQWASANIYYWNALPVDKVVAWPGDALSKDADGYYSCTIEGVNKINFLFSNGTEQTEDFTVKSSGEYWYENGKWTTTKPEIVPDLPTQQPEVTTAPEDTTKPDVTKGPSVTIAPGTGKTASFADTRTDFRDESIYFLMTTRFYDGDPGNNARTSHDDEVGNPASDPSWRGDFKGLIEKLDYIKALGFTTIWITPVVKNKSGYDYHGYHAYNFKQVDPRYESAGASYQDLIDAAHSKGIKIVQDIVLNHTGGSGEENLQTLSTNASGTITGQDSNNTFHHYDYIKSWESYDCQVTHIDGNCIDLNTENPNVSNYLIEAYNHYIDMGVDGFRIDTMKHISRLTFNKVFNPAFNAQAKKNGNNSFYMFGEVCARDENAIYFSHYACISAFFYTWAEEKEYAWGDMSTNEASVAQHWKDYEDYGDEKARAAFNSDNALLKGNEYHEPDTSMYSGTGVIDFPVHWSFRTAENAFNRAIQDDKLYNDATWNVVYVDSHDYAPNTMEKQRYAGGTEAWAENMSLMFTFRGIPCIYYGSEIEFKAKCPIDDYNNPLETSGRAYFGDHITGNVTASDFGVYTADGNVDETLSYPLAQHVRRLNLIRQSVPALRKGQYSKENVNGNMAYKRRYTDANVDSFVCVAVSDGATFDKLPGGTYTDVVTGDVQTVADGGSLKIAAPGKGNMRAYVLDTAKTKAPGKVGEDGTFLK